MKKWIVSSEEGFLHAEHERIRDTQTFVVRYRWDTSRASLFFDQHQAHVAIDNSIDKGEIDGITKVRIRGVELTSQATTDAPSDIEKLQTAVSDLRQSYLLKALRLEALEEKVERMEADTGTPEDIRDELHGRIDGQRKRLDLTDEQVRHLARAVADIEARMAGMNACSQEESLRVHGLEDRIRALEFCVGPKSEIRTQIATLKRNTTERLAALERPSLSHGWRLLERGEHVQPGDEHAIFAKHGAACSWVKADHVDIGACYTVPIDMGIYRRRF